MREKAQNSERLLDNGKSSTIQVFQTTQANNCCKHVNRLALSRHSFFIVCHFIGLPLNSSIARGYPHLIYMIQILH